MALYPFFVYFSAIKGIWFDEAKSNTYSGCFGCNIHYGDYCCANVFFEANMVN
jgi:hypothetical protein